MPILKLLTTFFLIINIYCDQTDHVRVHVIPHTHDDAGWIWTFEQYFYKTGGSWASVKSILDNMVLSLFDNPKRTFIYVEMAFFTKWYKIQSFETREQVKKLLHEGRFEFINGGYVMHDEATTYYQHIIDQMRLGLLFLKSEFDYIPKIGWFIDPFGHSSANAYILQKMGFDKIVIVRIDQKEKDSRIAKKNLEFYYKPFGQLDSETKIFTHVAYNHYCPPNGMDKYLSDTVLKISEAEMKIRAEQTYNDLKKWNKGYKHSNVLMMFGCDFSHNARDANFLNLEQTMQFINNNYSDMKMEYSTPSKYFKTIFNEVNEWPEYSTKDFFPYAENPYSYWTGFMTSRPYLKGLVRETGDYLLMSSRFIMEYVLYNYKSPKILDNLIDESIKAQFFMREKLAICQHHDAVAGTAKEKVSEDYISMLNDSIKTVSSAIQKLLETLHPKIKNKLFIANPIIQKESQNILNSNDKQIVEIFNPGLNGEYPISFEYTDSKIKLFGKEGNEIPTNIVCLNDTTNLENLKCVVNFTYKFKKNKKFYRFQISKSNKNEDIKGFKITDFSYNLGENNSKYIISFNLNEKKFTYQLGNELKYNFSLQHAFYDAYEGVSSIRPSNSNPDGAYIFSPVEEIPNSYSFNLEKSFIYKGNNFLQVTLRYERSSLHIKFREQFVIEVETVWDPIDTTEKDKGGKDYVLLISTDIKNNVKLPNNKVEPEFWTDSNGMKLMRRLKDYRQGYDYTVTEKVAANFYPVNYMMSIRDRTNYIYGENDYEGLNSTDRIFSVINDRSQSFGSMKEGEIIILLNRFSNKDDWKGLEEALFEKASSGYFYINHLIVLTNKFEQNHVRNYFHNKPTFITFISSDSPNNQLKFPKIIESSLINKMIEYSPNIVIDFHFIDPHTVFIQFANLDEPYFIQSNGEGKFIFRTIDKLEYTISEYGLGGNINMDKSKSFLKSSLIKEKEYSLNPQEFKLFLVKFTNESIINIVP